MTAYFLDSSAVIKRYVPEFVFVAADTRLLAAASAEGLATDDPNAHP